MARYELAATAEEDLSAIADYTIERFGIEQGRRYRDGLLTAFETLAESPRLGRDAPHIRRGYRRFEHRSHTIFYQVTDTGVRIMRILHRSMDPERHV